MAEPAKIYLVPRFNLDGFHVGWMALTDPQDHTTMLTASASHTAVFNYVEDFFEDIEAEIEIVTYGMLLPDEAFYRFHETANFPILGTPLTP